MHLNASIDAEITRLFSLEWAMSNERTFIAIKPDGVQRGLVGKIIKRFEQRGFKLVAMKLCKPGKEHLENHYADLKSKVNFLQAEWKKSERYKIENFQYLAFLRRFGGIHEQRTNLRYGLGGTQRC